MMTKLPLVAMLALTLTAFCAVAEADDTTNPPVITKLSRKAALTDMALEVYGKNFGSDAAKVKVSIDGRPCMLTFVSDTTIMLLTPSKARVGKTTMLLTVGGKKSNPFSIEILDRDKLGEDYWKRETERMEKSARESEEKRDEDLLTLTQLTTKPNEGGTYFVEIQGQAKELIDNCRVQVQLVFMGGSLGKKYSKVTGNQFTCLFGPFRKALFPGLYEINVRFLLHRQRYEVRYAWKKNVTKERSKKLAKLSGRAFYNVGSKELARSKSAEYLKLRQELLEKLEANLKECQDLYASSTRCYFRTNRKIDEVQWRKWLEGSGFVKSTEDWERILKDERTIRAGIHLDAVKWQRTITKQLMAIRTLYADFHASETAFLAPRFPKINQFTTEMFAVLFDLYVTRTLTLYKENRLKIPAALASQFGTLPFDQTPFTGVGRFKTLQTKIMRRFEEEMLAFETAKKPKEKTPKKPN